MEALTALRQAVIASQDIREDGTFLVINGTKWPAKTLTPFKMGSASATNVRYYPLITLWLQLVCKDKSSIDYMTLCRERKTDFVLVTDKRAVLEYLTGASDAASHIDAAMAMATAAGAGAAGGPSSAAGAVDAVSARALCDGRHHSACRNGFYTTR
jgi:hypothetical protein